MSTEQRLPFAKDQQGEQKQTKSLLDRDDIAKVRGVEGFPHGEDEAIRSISNPPYYTACPNPFMKDLIKKCGTPYEEKQDDYEREPFAFDVKEGRSGPIYNAHAYHTKVPHKAIMRFILHYTEPGDIVFDGFCGTGMTGVAAGKCGERPAVSALGYRVNLDGTVLDEQGKPFSRLGVRQAVLADLSPAATFIAYNYNTPLAHRAFCEAANRILREVEEECGWLYETRHVVDGQVKRDVQGNPIMGAINYVIWSDVFICPSCTAEVVFWQAAVSDGRVKQEFACPHCGASLTRRSLKRATERHVDIAGIITRAREIPVLINYSVGNRRYEKMPDDYDLELIQKIETSEIPYWYPTDRLPEGNSTRQPQLSHGITRVHHFYTKRNLWVIAALYDRIRKVETPLGHRLLFLLQSYSFTHSTKMSRIIFKSGGKRPVLTGNQSGTLYVSALPVEKNVLLGLLNAKLLSISRALSGIKTRSIITTQSSTALDNIPENSVDYIFTDPPFGSNLMYSELNFLWEAWLGVFTNSGPEAVESSAQKKGARKYQELMERCFREYYRILKPGRWMTVVFHNSKNRIWNAIQEGINRAGFVIADVQTMDKQQGSFKQVTSAGAVKQDLVISAYKPPLGVTRDFKLQAGTEEGVWSFVRNHLKYLPVFLEQDGKMEVVAERQGYLLFDRMVAFHVERGVTVPMDAAEFYAGLRQKFPERDAMYFLPDQVALYDKKRLAANGAQQLSLFISDEKSAIEWLKRELKTPQLFAEIQPQFLQKLHQVKHEDLPELMDLLSENFLQDDEGRWYVPDPNKQSDLEKLRRRALLRDFAKYRTVPGKLKIFRMEALRVGFKACWANRDYRTIVEVAKRLPASVLEEDSTLLMYYDNARLRLDE